jgi:hypothetical protein
LSRVTQKKLIGLALGEKSLLAAEVADGERPQVQRLAEWVYPEGVSPQQAEPFGKGLAEFLKQNEFSARHAVVGLPAKWLLVKAKDIPNAPAVTVEAMLRLQAESEFSSELKDLVFDYTARPGTAETGRSVLLIATPRRHIEWIEAICEAADLKAAAVTSSALALGITTGAKVNRPLLVLMSSAGASELTAQEGAASSAIRHLRPIEPMAAFVSELRRTVSTMPSAERDRELVLWGAEPTDADSLGKQLGWTVRGGTLRSLGVDDAPSGTNGDGQRYAPAVALAVAAMSEAGPAIDFLHSRLAPPPERRIPNWAYAAAALFVLLIGGSIYAYQYQQTQQQALDKLQAQLDAISSKVDAAKTFVDKVSVAQAWHAGQPRYLACLRDVTEVVPQDGQMYATNLTMKEITSSGNSAVKDPDVGKIQCQLDGKASNAGRPAELSDALKSGRAISDVQLGQTSYLPREQATQFTINFKYDPSKAAP